MKFEKRTDITGVHAYAGENFEFPLLLYEKNDWDRTQMSYIDSSKHTTKSLIDWCKSHHIDFDIAYPLKISAPIRHPFRHLRYLRLIHSLQH